MVRMILSVFYFHKHSLACIILGFFCELLQQCPGDRITSLHLIGGDQFISPDFRRLNIGGRGLSEDV